MGGAVMLLNWCKVGCKTPTLISSAHNFTLLELRYVRILNPMTILLGVLGHHQYQKLCQVCQMRHISRWRTSGSKSMVSNYQLVSFSGLRCMQPKQWFEQ